MKILTLRGTPRAMGRAFGESCREAIAEFYARRRDNAIARALELGDQTVDEADLLELAQACYDITREHYDPRGADELLGIAEGSGLSVARIVAMNGLTDLRDVLTWPSDPTHGAAQEGCTSFVARTDTGEVICGQTWDLATDNLPFMMLVHREPDAGPATWSLTTTGCLSLIGINEAGVCIGNTNLSTRDSRPGVMYLSIIHKALAQTTLADAARCVTDAPRAGAHYYYLADRAGLAVGIECTARQHHVRQVDTGHFVHTNHCLIDAHRAIETRVPTLSSGTRLERMAMLLDQADPLDAAATRRALADRFGGPCAICIDDIMGLNTNGAAVMAPQQGRMWACHGQPTDDTWIEVTHRP